MTCQHHWLIEAPHAVSMLTGTCKLCGATREFPAFQPDNKKNFNLADRKRK